jgi:hypothetical protein
MCQVVVIMTIARLLAEGQEIGDIPGNFPQNPLAEWDEEDWTALQDFCSDVSNNLLRNDADASAADSEEDARTYGLRGRWKIYKTKLDRILRFIRLHKALSPFRKTLTEQLQDETISNKEKPNIDPELIKTFWYVLYTLFIPRVRRI